MKHWSRNNLTCQFFKSLALINDISTAILKTWRKTGNQSRFQCLQAYCNLRKARASAWRGINTPGRCHQLIYQNNSSLWHLNSRNKAKSLDHEYRSLTHIYILRSSFVSHRSIIPNMTFIHQTIFKILSTITGLQNIGHWPTFSTIQFYKNIRPLP